MCFTDQVDEGIFASTLIRKIPVLDEETGGYIPAEELEGVPEWVADAYEAGWLQMTPDDDFKNLWVAVPVGEILGMQVAIKATGSDILISHGNWIGVIKDAEWKG